MLGTKVWNCLRHHLCLRLLETTCIYLIWHFIKGKFTATLPALLPRRPKCVSFLQMRLFFFFSGNSKQHSISSFSCYISAVSVIFPDIYLRWPTEAVGNCDTCSNEVWFYFLTVHLQILRITIYTVKHFFCYLYLQAVVCSVSCIVVWN